MSQPDDKKNVKATVADEDLDDLDDVLDEFNGGASSKPSAGASTSASASTSAPSGSGSGSVRVKKEEEEGDDDVKPSAAAAVKAEGDDEDPLDDPELAADFAKEFAAGMEALMRELGGADPLPPSADGAASASAGAGEKGAAAAATGPQMPNMSEDEMIRQFEAMMSEMGLAGMTSGAGPNNGAGPSSAAAGPSSSSSSSAAAPPANFQDAIKATMTRLKESSDTAAASSSSAGGPGIPGLDGMTDADIEKILASLGAGGAGAEGLDGEEGLAKMLENMMGELMSKEVLHEPLKELRDKYPAYLSSDKGKALPSTDRARFEKQLELVSEIVKTFELKDFDEGSEERKAELKKRVGDLMNEMQETGAPPDEIVGELPPELGNMPGLGGAPGEEQCSVM